MALARQRRHQQALASLMGKEGSWLHQQRSMGSPGGAAQNPRSPARLATSRALMGAARAVQLGHAGQLGLAVHGGPLTYLGQGPAATETEPVLGPAVADAGTRHLIRRPAPGWSLRSPA